MIPGEQEYRDALLSPSLGWEQTGKDREEPMGSTVTGMVVGRHASAMVRREHSSACGQVTHASDQPSSSKRVS